MLSLPTRFIIARKKESSTRRSVSRRSINKQVLEMSLFPNSEYLPIYTLFVVILRVENVLRDFENVFPCVAKKSLFCALKRT